MTPKRLRKKDADRDMFDDLGALIGGQIKKGMSKFEEMMAESKKGRGEGDFDEDGQFMGYVKAFLDDRSVGSVTPSSKYLVERMVKSAALEDARVVVEYGPAHGVITTKPATIPEASPNAVGLPTTTHSAANHDPEAALPAIAVVANAMAATPPATGKKSLPMAIAEPALNPNQPTISRPAPISVQPMLCGTNSELG